MSVLRLPSRTLLLITVSEYALWSREYLFQAYFLYSELISKSSPPDSEASSTAVIGPSWDTIWANNFMSTAILALIEVNGYLTNQ